MTFKGYNFVFPVYFFEKKKKFKTPLTINEGSNNKSFPGQK